jgi:hypothetical protein
MNSSKRKYVLIILSLMTSFLMVSTAMAVTFTKNVESKESIQKIEKDESDSTYLKKVLDIENVDFSTQYKINLPNIDNPEVLSIELAITLILGTIFGLVLSGLTLVTTPVSWPLWGILYVLNRETDPSRAPPTQSEKLTIFTIATILGPISAFFYGYLLACYFMMPGVFP